jgi:hypothetical protein
MDFIVITKTAPAGTINQLYVRGLTEEVWKAYPAIIGDEGTDGHYLITGRWGTDAAEAALFLRKEMEIEIKKWSRHGDPRPSQVRRMNILQSALTQMAFQAAIDEIAAL